MTERFSAFISYSHSDEPIARWLHRAIETYRFPRGIVGLEGQFGAVPGRLPPVFRDREELAASGDLGAELRQALACSRFLIVICSPRSAQSHWVNEEILAFKRQHGENRCLALIASGEPNVGGALECFPEALRFRLGPDGAPSGEPAEPIAADIRPGKDGKRLASRKLLAGLSGVRLDVLVRRDTVRRQRQLMFTTAAASMVALFTLGLAVYAEGQRRVAVEQRDLAESSLEFLIGTFEVANPATENPRTITALTFLDRASERAVVEFRQQPQVAARLLRATGDIYYNLGLPQESERALLTALKLEPSAGAGRATTLLKLASVAKSRGDVDAVESLIEQAVAAHDGENSRSAEIEAMVAEQEAHIAHLKAEYPLAAERYAAAVVRYQQLPGDHRGKIGENLMNQAHSLVQANDFTQVDRLYEQARDVFVAKFGVRDVRTARSFHNQALANLSANQPDAAVAEMTRALRIYQRVLEPRHPNFAAAHLLMGRILSGQGRHEEASASFSQARQIFASLYGADNPALGDVDFYAAEAEARGGRFDKAKSLAANVKRIYDLHYGADDPDQVALLLLRSRIDWMAGNGAAARQRCRSAMALQRKIENKPNVIGNLEKQCNELT